MSEDYEKFHEIAPFTVNIDPSIQVNDEDSLLLDGANATL